MLSYLVLTLNTNQGGIMKRERFVPFLPTLFFLSFFQSCGEIGSFRSFSQAMSGISEDLSDSVATTNQNETGSLEIVFNMYENGVLKAMGQTPGLYKIKLEITLANSNIVTQDISDVASTLTLNSIPVGQSMLSGELYEGTSLISTSVVNVDIQNGQTTTATMVFNLSYSDAYGSNESGAIYVESFVNLPPFIKSTTLSRQFLYVGDILDIEIIAEDPELNFISFNWVYSGLTPERVDDQSIAGKASFKFLSAGTYDLKVEIVDELGAKTTLPITIPVSEPGSIAQDIVIGNPY